MHQSGFASNLGAALQAVELGNDQFRGGSA
jgi:hypothetical protein